MFDLHTTKNTEITEITTAKQAVVKLNSELVVIISVMHSK